MTTYSPAVTCYEEHGSVSESFKLGEWTAEVTLRVAWNLRYALVNDLLSNKRPFPHGSYSVLPQAHAAVITPFPGAGATSGQGLDYEDALVKVSYSSKAKDLISEELEPTVQFRKEDYKRFRWGAADGDPLVEAEAPGTLVRGLNIVRTYYQLTTIHTDFLTLIGSCNNAIYSSVLLGLTFAAETLLYHPPVVSRTITTAGSDGYTLKAKYTYKAGGWNHYWRQKTQSFEQIYDVNGDVYESYPPADFSNILA